MTQTAATTSTPGTEDLYKELRAANEKLQKMQESLSNMEKNLTDQAKSTVDMGDAIKGMENMQIAQGVGSLCSAAGQVTTAFVSMHFQKKAIKHRRDTQLMQYVHQATMAKIEKDTKIDQLKGQEDMIKIQVAGNKELLKATENRAREEGKLAVVEATIKDQKLTEEVGKPNNEKALNSILASYSYGNPLYS